MKKYVVLLLTILFFALIPFFVDIFWSAADDPRYIFVTSGAYTGLPSGSLLYVGSLYGSFVAFLYNMCPSLEWYSLLYYFFFILAIGIFVIKLLILDISRAVKLLGWVCLCVIHVYMALSPQSTFLAADLSIASIVLIYRYQTKCELIGALIIFFLATQFRLFGALMPYLIILPIFFLNSHVSLKNILRYVFPFFFCVLLSGITFGADALRYNSTKEWQQFKKFDAARCYIADNPLSDQLVSQIKNKEDKLSYELFQKYRIYDTNIMTVDKMVSYAALMKTYRLQNILNNLSSYKNFYVSYGIVWLVLFVLCGSVSFILTRKYKRLLLLFLVLLLFLFANLFMMAQSEAKERALMGALFSLLLAVIVIFGKEIKYIRSCYLLLVLGVCFQFSRHIKQVYNSIMDKKAYLQETEAILNSSLYEKIYMPVPTCIDPEAFHSSNSPIAHKTIIQGWLQIFPESNPKYRHLTAFTDGLPVLVRKDSKEQLCIIRELLDMHYGVKTKLHILKSSKNYELILFKTPR